MLGWSYLPLTSVSVLVARKECEDIMNRKNLVAIIASLGLMLGSVAPAEEDLSVLPEKIDGVAPADMMKHYLLGLADQQFENWKHQYEQRTTPEQIAEYQRRLREKFIKALGCFPERTPLNPKITGTISRNDYRVEKIIFESRPKHYVTGILFLPNASKHKPPYPGVLVRCGHSPDGKGSNIYQTMGALLALNGIVGFVFDPIDQGDEVSYFHNGPS